MPSVWAKLEAKADPKIIKDDTRKNWTEVLNTNRPAPVVIERIVPILSWTNTGGSNAIVERFTDTIRVYFDGDWYSSGEGEQVAVFYLDNDAVNSTCVPIEFEPVISQFGVDPAAEPQALSDRSDILQLLKSKKMFLSAAGYLDNIPLNGLEYDPSPDASGQMFCHPASLPTGIDAAIFPIEFSPPEPGQEGRFFIDIKLNRLLSDDLYFPFVRFAIARFQPNTIKNTTAPDGTTKNYRFSKIAVTDFVQPLPYRKLELKDNKPVKYYAKVRRKNMTEGTNKVYVFYEPPFEGGDNSLFGRMDPTEPLVIEGLSGSHIKLDKSDPINIDIKDPVKPSFKYIVEEYEQYESKLKVNDKSSPRNDFSQRLVFSYIIDV